MNEKDFYLMVGADCEATGHAVADAQLGERATRGFVDIAVEAGMLATLLAIHFGFTLVIVLALVLYRVVGLVRL